MPDKPFEKLCSVDKRLRRLFPVQMWNNNQTIVNIRMFGGFEIFNTRKYHNYESWADGYEITNGDGSIKVTAEDLDDALAKFEEKVRGKTSHTIPDSVDSKRAKLKRNYKKL